MHVYTQSQLRRKTKAELAAIAGLKACFDDMKKAELIELIEMRQREEADLYDEPEHAASGTAQAIELMQTESAKSPAHRILSRTRGTDRLFDIVYSVRSASTWGPTEEDMETMSEVDVFEFRTAEGSRYLTEAQVMAEWRERIGGLALSMPDHEGWGFLQEQLLDSMLHGVHRRLEQIRGRINDQKAALKSHMQQNDGTEIWDDEHSRIIDRMTDLIDQERFLEAALSGAQVAFRDATGKSGWSPRAGASDVRHHRLTANVLASDELLRQRQDEERTRMDIERGFALVVTGGREFTDSKFIWRRLDDALARHRQRKPEMPFVLLHGNARGLDKIAGAWAKEKGIDVITFEPYWQRFGKRAGYLRNERMLKFAMERAKSCGLLAFPGGKGTGHCVESAKRLGMLVVDATMTARA